VDAIESIATVETVLRQAIRTVLGPAWHEGSKVDTAVLAQRRDQEAKQRDGVVVSSDLLDFTHVWDLEALITQHWPSFKPIFHDQARFKVYMKRLTDVRNAPAHSRKLLPFEIDLISGIAGELRNCLILWRSKKAPDMTYYPIVESITDSLGNEIPSFPHHGNVALSNILEVGDVIEFRCVGSDPQSRPLSWSLAHMAHIGPTLDSQVGNDVSLRWTVAERHVADPCVLVLSMASSGKYHRQIGTIDAMFSLLYTVNPPRI
jgi:hypothetical protein